ncbi:MAG: hypothetical protein IKQ99_02725 [Alphaproteobacteria bacterium]|nr:hypothetical protein [Alphaproteobacteria bacterium]
MTSSTDKFLSVGPIDAFPSTRVAAKELGIFSDRIDSVHMPRKTKIGATLRKDDSSVRACASKAASAR